MKKVGILTHHSVNNQGAQLQMYSMYKIIEKVGYKPYIITYQMNYDNLNKEDKKRNNVSLASIPYYLKEYFIKRGFPSLLLNVNKYLKHKYFFKKNFRTASLNDSFDAIVVGSDEVYSLEAG